MDDQPLSPEQTKVMIAILCLTALPMIIFFPGKLFYVFLFIAVASLGWFYFEKDEAEEVCQTFQHCLEGKRLNYSQSFYRTCRYAVLKFISVPLIPILKVWNEVAGTPERQRQYEEQQQQEENERAWREYEEENQDDEFDDFEEDENTQEQEEHSRAGKKPKMGRKEALTNLEVPFDATDDEIRSAFIKLQKKYNPDAHAGKDIPEEWIELANKETAKINDAYYTIFPKAEWEERVEPERGNK